MNSLFLISVDTMSRFGCISCNHRCGFDSNSQAGARILIWVCPQCGTFFAISPVPRDIVGTHVPGALITGIGQPGGLDTLQLDHIDHPRTEGSDDTVIVAHSSTSSRGEQFSECFINKCSEQTISGTRSTIEVDDAGRIGRVAHIVSKSFRFNYFTDRGSTLEFSVCAKHSQIARKFMSQIKKHGVITSTIAKESFE